MPLYEFHCTNCEKNFESITKPYDPVECKHCSAREVTKVISMPAVYNVGKAEFHHKAEKKGDRVRAIMKPDLESMK